MATRPKDLIYAVGEHPPLPQLAMLGLQHVAALAPYLVLIAIVIAHSGDDVQDARNAVSLGMIAIAVMAVLQSLRAGPVGSGYLAPPVVSAIYLSPCLLAADRGGLPLVCGMIIFAGMVEACLCWVLPRLRKIFPPVVSGMIVMAVGFELGLIGIKEFFHEMPHLPGGGPWYYFVAALTLGLMIGLSVWGKGMLRLLCSLIGITTGFVVAALAGLITPAHEQAIGAAPYVALPDPGFLSYGFDPELMIPFAIAALASGLRVIGVVTTCQRINDADWKRPETTSIRGGILADGLGCALSGALGTPGTSAAPSLVGISKASGATSRRIAWAIGAWLLVLACLPKLAVLVLTMPMAVVGAALIFNGSFMIVAGIQIITSRPINVRTTLVIGVPTLFGLSHEVIPQFYAGLPSWVQPITGSVINITLIGAVLANLVFYLGRKRSQTITLAEKHGDKASVLRALSEHGSNWEVRDDVLARGHNTLSDLLDLLASGNNVTGPIELHLAYDDFELTIELAYQGFLPQLPTDQQPTDDMVEEQSFVVGLSGYLTSLQADRVERSAKGDQCQLKLIFED